MFLDRVTVDFKFKIELEYKFTITKLKQLFILTYLGGFHSDFKQLLDLSLACSVKAYTVLV
jgi:hypothetical protein